MRVLRSAELVGSARWLQYAANHNAELITSQLPIRKSEQVTLQCPAKIDYAGYDLDRPLREFWPGAGPHFDGLIKAGEKLFLLEANAHVAELFSHCAAKEPHSRELIERSLSDAKKFYRARPDANWLSPFYQYCNRLAHLYFLREVNGLDAHLVFVYFLNDTAQGKVCPKTVPGWEKVVMVLQEAIGMTGKMPRAAHTVYVDVQQIEGRSWK